LVIFINVILSQITNIEARAIENMFSDCRAQLIYGKDNANRMQKSLIYLLRCSLSYAKIQQEEEKTKQKIAKNKEILKSFSNFAKSF